MSEDNQPLGDPAPDNGNGAGGSDARALGFEEEFASGIYTCSQVVHWADEQWLAWLSAAEQDGKAPEEDVTRPLEISAPAREYVHVRSRKPQRP